MSHRKAWRAIHHSGQAWGLVFEDDVRVSPDFIRILSNVDWAPAGADIIRIEASDETHLSMWSWPVADRRLYRLKGLVVCAGGYLISQNACGRLLQVNVDCRFPVDRFLFDPRSPLYSTLVTYVLVPALCIQERLLSPGAQESLLGADRQSLIDHWDQRHRDAPMPKLGLGEIAKREVNRLAGQLRRVTSRRVAIGWR